MDDLEERLAETQRELEQLREEFVEFSYLVSHDLGAPLRHINGFSEIILKRNEGMFDEKTVTQFGFVVSSANLMSDMLEGLLEYSRINTDPFAFALCDLSELIEFARASLDDSIGVSKAEISICPMPRVVCDEARITRVIHHLLNNAILYREPDVAPVIEVSCTEKEDAWQICVRDNGIGISDNFMEQVFKPLKRAVRPDHYPGVGMGLAISERIVKAHGGVMWVKSSRVTGSAFYFTLSKSLKKST